MASMASASFTRPVCRRARARGIRAYRTTISSLPRPGARSARRSGRRSSPHLLRCQVVDPSLCGTCGITSVTTAFYRSLAPSTSRPRPCGVCEVSWAFDPAFERAAILSYATAPPLLLSWLKRLTYFLTPRSAMFACHLVSFGIVQRLG